MAQDGSQVLHCLTSSHGPRYTVYGLASAELAYRLFTASCHPIYQPANARFSTPSARRIWAGINLPNQPDNGPSFNSFFKFYINWKWIDHAINVHGLKPAPAKIRNASVISPFIDEWPLRECLETLRIYSVGFGAIWKKQLAAWAHEMKSQGRTFDGLTMVKNRWHRLNDFMFFFKMTVVCAHGTADSRYCKKCSYQNGFTHKK